jgi:hypothetical protein
MATVRSRVIFGGSGACRAVCWVLRSHHLYRLLGRRPPGFGPGPILKVVAMTTTTPDLASSVLVPVADPLFTLGERQALAGFLSCYRGLTCALRCGVAAV